MEKTTFNRVVIIALLAWAIIVALNNLANNLQNPQDQKPKETSYERVLRTQTLRCGYVLYPPAVLKDPNSGELSGLAYDLMQKIGERLNVKIEWSEEVTFATNVQGIQSNRYDAVCITYWANPNEGKYLAFTQPFYFSGMVGAQNCDKTKPIDQWNDAAVRFVTIDGTVESRLIASRFAAAQKISLPNTSDISQMMVNVTSGKADIALIEPYQMAEWNAHNADQKLCADPDPIVTFPNVLALAPDDVRFKSMIDAALGDIINSGEMEQILQKWEKYPGTFYRVAKAYR